MSDKLLGISDIAVRGPDLFLSARFQAALETLAGKAAIQIGGSEKKDDKTSFATEAVRPDWRKGLSLARPLLRESPDLRLLISLMHSILADQSQPAELGQRMQQVLDLAELIAELLVTRWQSVHPLIVDEDGELDTGTRVGTLALLGDKVLVARPILQHCQALLSPGFDSGWSDQNLRSFLDRVDAVIEKIEQTTREGSPEDRDFRYGELREVLQELRKRLPAATPDAFMASEPEPIVAPTSPLADPAITAATTITITAEPDAVQGLNAALQHFESAKPDHLMIGLLKMARTQVAKRPGANQRELCIEVLEHVAKYIENAEPSSPVPILLRRAMSIHGKSFMELLASFGGTALTDMLHDSKLIPKPPADAKPASK